MVSHGHRLNKKTESYAISESVKLDAPLFLNLKIWFIYMLLLIQRLVLYADQINNLLFIEMMQNA